METNKKGAKLAIVVIIAYLLIPLAMTLIYSLFEEWIDVLPKRFTLTAYIFLIRCSGFPLAERY